MLSERLGFFQSCFLLEFTLADDVPLKKSLLNAVEDVFPHYFFRKAVLDSGIELFNVKPMFLRIAYYDWIFFDVLARILFLPLSILILKHRFVLVVHYPLSIITDLNLIKSLINYISLGLIPYYQALVHTSQTINFTTSKIGFPVLFDLGLGLEDALDEFLSEELTKSASHYFCLFFRKKSIWH